MVLSAALLTFAASLALTAGLDPPTIVFPPNDLDDPDQAKAGTADFTLSCSATGSLPMNFRWEKSGKELQEIPPYRTITESMFSSNVTIRILEPFDDGKYQCFVNNPAGGTFSRKLRLKVTATSPFKEADTVEKPVNVTIGRPLYLACPEQTTGSRQGDFGAFYFWGIKQLILKRLPMKANIAMLPNGDLFFTYVAQEDINNNLQLQCFVEAGNNVYRSHKYTLKVVGTDNSNIAPKFAPGGEPKQMETAVQGKEKFLHCVASGNPPPRTRWYRVLDNGQTIKIINATEGFLIIPRANYGRVLHIPKVSKEQHEPGHYKCEVSNGVGSTLVSKLIKITVNVRPMWTVKPPTRKVVPVLGDAMLICEAFGTPSPKLKWYHDGTEFTSDTELAPHIKVDGNKLLFKKIQMKNEGVYQCAVENDWGMLVSSTWVRVRARAPKIKNFGPFYIFRKADAVLQCDSNAAPAAHHNWYKNDQPITISGRYSLDAQKSLVITSVNSADEGKYTCKAINDLGEDEAFNQATVYNKTEIFRPPKKNLFISLKKALNLHCEARADAILKQFLTYKWLKDGREMKYDSRVRWIENQNILKIGDASDNDAAMYTCIAFTNAPQRSEDRATVIVDVAKGVPFPPSDLKITSCHNRTTIITWTKGKDNDAPITHFVVEQESTYYPEEWHVIANITDLTKTSFTLKLTAWANLTFRMRAINKIGPSRARMATPKGKCVTSMFRPLMYPRNFRGVPGKAGELDIAWTPMTKLEANGPGLHYILRYRKVLRDRRKLTHWVSVVIRNPTLDHYSIPYAGYYQLWEFQITAKNDVGEGPISETVRSFSGQDAPKSKPGNVKIGKVSARSIELSWDRVMVSRGSVDGYNIYYWTQNKATPQVLKFMSTRQAYVLKQEVTGLTPFTSYTLSITAFNSGGEGPQSDAINFDTLDDAGVTPPAITFQPNDLDDPDQAKAGTAQFTLSCSATGSLPMTFRWEKSGKHLQEIRPYRTITESMFSSNVTIRTLEPFDDGKYQCFVNNPAGGTFSRKLRLKVTETSPFKDADTVEKPVNVTIGRPLYLACPEQMTGSRQGDFGAFYFWGIKRQLILKWLPMRANIAMLPNGDLFFTYVDQEDINLLKAYPFNLQLQCFVMAGNSFYRSHKYSLKVVGPDAFAPAFAPGGEPKQVETAVQGKEKFLHCVASGNPAPQTRWYRVFDNNGQTREIINAIEGFLIPRANYGRVLHIPKVSKQQHEPGHYKCEVSNGVGSTLVSKLIKITVNVPPVWSVKPPTRKVVPVLGDATLTCEAFGSPSPKLKWYHDGTEFTSDTELAPHIIVDGNRLLFKKIQMKNEGVYQCAVENDWGMLVSSTWVRVKGSS